MKKAIYEFNKKEVNRLLNDPDLVLSGHQAEPNFKFQLNNFMLSPLLFAIQCFPKDANDISIIKDLLDKYADRNYCEAINGFNSLMMACHLNTESDALKIIKVLCEHKYYEG